MFASGHSLEVTRSPLVFQAATNDARAAISARILESDLPPRRVPD
jgi:hypothetical protein